MKVNQQCVNAYLKKLGVETEKAIRAAYIGKCIQGAVYEGSGSIQ